MSVATTNQFVYVTGGTGSTNFPITYGGGYAGNDDAFIMAWALNGN